jgi:hypothetical protein
MYYRTVRVKVAFRTLSACLEEVSDENTQELCHTPEHLAAVAMIITIAAGACWKPAESLLETC